MDFICVISNPKLSCENLRSMTHNLCLVSSGIFVLVKQKILRTTLSTKFYFVAKSTLHQAGIVSMQRMFTWKSQSHNSQPASNYTDCCVRWQIISCSLMILLYFASFWLFHCLWNAVVVVFYTVMYNVDCLYPRE